MRIAQQVLDEPNANPVPNLGVRVRRKRDGVTLATVTTDENGIAHIEGDGHFAPFFLQTTNQVGGPRLWNSDDTIAAGAFSPAEVVFALRAFGDGYIPGLLGALAVSLNGTSLGLATGGALVAGYPVINYTADTFSLTRPSSGTRTDRLVVRVYGEAHEDHGLAEFAILTGEVGGGAPSLTQTSSVYEVALATVTVPSAGSLSLVDDRVQTLGMFARKAPVAGVARAASVSTSDTNGAALLSLDLSLTESVTYDIEAEFGGYQASVDSETFPWEYSYGGYGSGAGQFNYPVDIAFSPDGAWAYVTDYGNNRVVRLSYAGGVLTWSNVLTGKTQASAICTDSTGLVYYLYGQNPQWLEQKGSTLTSSGFNRQLSNNLAHIGLCTDNTYLYLTVPSDGSIRKHAISTGSQVAAVYGWGSAQGIEYMGGNLYIASYNGSVYRGSPSTLLTTATLLTIPGEQAFGVATDGTDLYVTATDNQVRKVSPSGSLLATFGTYGSGPGQLNGPRGITVDPFGDIWVADASNHRLQRFGAGTVFGGYGSVAVGIDGNVSTYLGRGATNGPVGNAHTRSVSGPATVTVAGYGKATADTIVLNSCVLSARAVPRV